MFPYLLKIGETCLLSLENSAHPSKCCTFETFAAVEGVTIFDHAYHVARDRINEGTCGVNLAEGEFIVVSVIKGVA